MERHLFDLIHAYRQAVADAVAELSASGISLPQSNIEWSLSPIPCIGSLRAGGQYRKHGYGCTVETAKGEVDFDFGPHGEVDGFDAWRLWRFADARAEEFGFLEESQIRSALERALKGGELRRGNSGLS
jgi:hypothetical protein